jgi:hypothetical protein
LPQIRYLELFGVVEKALFTLSDVCDAI